MKSVKVHFVWSPAAEAAFMNLKSLFSSARVLTHFDPTAQFVVEVDASDCWGGPLPKIHFRPEEASLRISFLLAHPSGEQLWCGKPRAAGGGISPPRIEALAEGLDSPICGKDWPQKPVLPLIRSQAQLTPGSVGSVLGQFNFTLNYWPGFRNIKPDAISCQFSAPVEDSSEETILPSSYVVGAAR